jgi:hypothetical protein
MPLGRLNPAKQYYQASGASTPQQEMPAKFKATPQPSHSLNAQQYLRPEYLDDIKREPIVNRVPRTVGMRYLYARGIHRQPIERMGNNVGPQPNISRFQPNDFGPIHDAGFNDALYQAGYPGFNLGLSFKVPSIKTMGGPRNEKGRWLPITLSSNRKVNRLSRPVGGAPTR